MSDVLSPEQEAKIKADIAAYRDKLAAMRKRIKPGTDIWLYGQDAFCIHCVQSISLEAAMVAGAVRKGETSYIGGPGNYAERLPASAIAQWTAEMAEAGLGPCECEDLKPVAPTEGPTE